MWRQLIEFGNRLLSLARRVQQLEESNQQLRLELRDVRADVKDRSQEDARLSEIVHVLAIELQRNRENAERDRAIQRLQLENTLLRFERGLPSADAGGSDRE